MKIFLDYDSTLVNFTDTWVKLINELTNDKIQLHEVDRWGHPILEKHTWLFFDYDIYSHVTPFAGAVDFVRYLHENHDLTILTHTYSQNNMERKRAHIHQYFGADINIIQTATDKHLFTEGGILIDDGWHNVKGHLENTNEIGILFNFENRYAYVPKTVMHWKLYHMTDYQHIIDLIES
jgi:hypothetical protein